MARTIFLFIRGLDQTSRAFSGVKKNLNAVQQLQQTLWRQSYRLLFGSAALALGMIKTSQVLFGFMERTTQGALVMDDFNRSIDRLKDALGEQATDKLSPLLMNLSKAIDELAGSSEKMSLVMNILLSLGGLATLGIAGGTIKILANLIGIAISGILWSALQMLTLISPGAGMAFSIGTLAAGQALTAAVPIVLTIGAVLAINWAVEHFFGERAGAAFTTTSFVSQLWDWIMDNNEVEGEMPEGEGLFGGLFNFDAASPQLGTGTGIVTGPIQFFIEIVGDFFGTPEENGEAIGLNLGDRIKNLMGALVR